MLISISKASEILGVKPKTIRRWEEGGKIQVVYTPNGHRRFDEDYIKSLLKNTKDK